MREAVNSHSFMADGEAASLFYVNVAVLSTTSKHPLANEEAGVGVIHPSIKQPAY